MTLEDREWVLLEQASVAVPPPAAAPAVGTDAGYPDFITNLLLTVLDLRLQNAIVNNSIQYYGNNRWDEVRTLKDPDDFADKALSAMRKGFGGHAEKKA